MTFSTKRRIKWWLALATFFVGFYCFILLGAGFYAVGLAGFGVAIFNVVLWPRVWWAIDKEISGKRLPYLFLASLMIPTALLLFAALFQGSSGAPANGGNSAGAEQR